ncbi:MAG: phosphoenolpyruvate synthase [Rhodospirillaceae bacterium]|nr:phosphoenolpyruvate synthase [Rhodospirillaceae bacterium]
MEPYVIRFTQIGKNDISQVGGKNASLGELIQNLNKLGIRVPDGFATTAIAFTDFLQQENLDKKIISRLENLDVTNVPALTKAGADIRQMIIQTPLPNQLKTAIKHEWNKLKDGNDITVAVRSSATAEDLPEASFAGQQETLLNVSGIDNVLTAIHEVFASLYNDRAIAYRVHQGFKHQDVSLSVGIQKMIRSDLGSSGVIFTLDTESGFRDVVFITSSYGLGETVVQGAVNPDEFYIYKKSLSANKKAIIRKNLGTKQVKMIYADDPAERVKTIKVPESEQKRFSLNDKDIETLSQQAILIEEHYGTPMDIEWGKDGTDNQLYILQARPETVQSQAKQVMVRYSLQEKSEILTKGRSIGQRIGSGIAKVVRNIEEMDLIQPGDILVSDMTDPDWEPVMKRAAGVVTNRGGRTCHAAIIARELGIPAVVGCGHATEDISNGMKVTVSCAEGEEGFVYEGILKYKQREIALEKLPDIPVKIKMNVGNPDRAFNFSSIPNHGVGLARLEFIINRMIGIHPRALLNYDNQDILVKELIDEHISGYCDPVSFYIEKLSEGIATIAAAFSPKPVIVRLSDFKSNEYANLIGGKKYEPTEENPMLGFRGASRYLNEDFRRCFELECEAIKKVRNDMGLENVQVMIPFVRTIVEAEKVISLLTDNDLIRGKNNLKLIMMSELPSNALLAEEFLEYFDGMSIGSNDMTQLTLGLDRDSGKIAELFNEQDIAVKKLLAMTISACKKQGKYIGICGQGPSDHPDLARWLLEKEITSMSLNPDSVLDTWLLLAKKTQTKNKP